SVAMTNWPKKKGGPCGPPFGVPFRQAPDETLALGELEGAASLGAAVLLALDGARVTGKEATLLQHGAKLRLEVGEGARDAVTHGACLARKPATLDGDVNVELTGAVCRNDRLLDNHLKDRAREVRGEVLVV